MAELVMQKTGRDGIVGDGDPLDICVITEKAVSHGNILVEAHPVGGLRMLDGNEADDKIIAVLEGHVYGRDEARDVIRRSHEDYLRRFSELADML